MVRSSSVSLAVCPDLITFVRFTFCSCIVSLFCLLSVTSVLQYVSSYLCLIA